MKFRKLKYPYWDSINSENWYDYEARFPARCGAPPESAADDVVFAILEKLLQRELNQNIQDLRTQLRHRRKHLVHGYLPGVTMGIVLTPNYLHKEDWMHDEMEHEKASVIEEAFEGFINQVEWEDE